MRLVVRRGESEAREHGVEQCGSVVLRQQGLFPCARSGRGLVSEPHRALERGRWNHTSVPQRRGRVRPVPGAGRSAMSTSRADTNQTADRTPEDLVRVREAAQAVGVTDATVRTWIARGHLTAYLVLQPAPITIQVSLAAVRTLQPPRDPQTPPDTLPIFPVAGATGVPRALIASWMRWSLQPTWEGRLGALLRVADVRALAQQRGRLPRSDEAGEDAVALNDGHPAVPADLVSVREAARSVGMTPSAVQTWIRRGRLSAQPGPLGRQVSLADVQAIASQRPGGPRPWRTRRCLPTPSCCGTPRARRA